ncbi:MAG: ATP-binding protein [Verrucomicrobia bacterium]|nr:ATP-binding protein [Verrucomicrobiota bacterium]
MLALLTVGGVSSLALLFLFYVRPLRRSNSAMQHQMLHMGKEFIANASHELKTPITIIRGFAETLKDLPEVSDVMFDSILEKIIRNCERMENLVASLLILTDLENNRADVHVACDLVPLLENICTNLLNLHPEAHFEALHNEDHIIVHGNSHLLELAFSNVLRNALKYSPNKQHITIKLERSIETTLISIKDCGMGMKKDDLDHIFERFYTVDKAHSRKLGGAGLGLSIVKMIMDQHQVKTTVTSELGKGTAFSFSFPNY